MKSFPLLFVFLFSCTFLSAQIDLPEDLFIPTEIQKAYRSGTRTLDGRPGPHFWQNHATYNIEVEVLPEDRYIKGKAAITYTNNSPDALDYLFLTLLYDISRKGNVRNEAIPEEWLSEGTQINELTINGQTIDLSNRDRARRFGTNLRISLPESLEAGGKLAVDIDWEEALPDGDAGRHGYVDSTTCFVGYWYPKISVYDDIDGWDTNSFLGMAEFYGELSDLEVAITIPRQYSVWATGAFQNAEEVLPEPLLGRFQEAATAETPVTIIGEEDLEGGLRMKSNTWRFKADQVPDFGFAFSDHYLWDGISLPTARHRVRIHSVYPPSRKAYCENVTGWQRDIMQFFSEEMPGTPFPYSKFTSFYKPYPSGGMEYPMMANNGSPQQDVWMVGLTAHEMYHMYVPFYLRINEEKYAWMDEGWADFMDVRATAHVLGNEPTVGQRINQKLNLERTFGSFANVPMITSSEYQSSDNYGFTSYTHPAFIYGLLEEALGESLFKECLQGYMERWAHKSPTPYDFFFSFNDLSGQNLNWFWRPWFTEFGYPDLGVADVQPGKVTVVKKGNKPISIQITAVYENGDTLKKETGIAIWKTEDAAVVIDLDDERMPQRVFLNEWLPDIDLSDNYFLAEEITAGMDMGAYAGTYSLGTNNSVGYVTAGRQHLLLESTGTGNTYLLLPIAEDTFATPDGTFTVEFLRDASGKVAEYKAMRLGNAITGERKN